MNHKQDQIIDTIVKDLKSKNNNWINQFNNLPRTKRQRLVKDIFSNYCNSIIDYVNSQDPKIHIHNLGTLSIKPSRKQFLDLMKSGVDKDEVIKIVKESYKTLNNK